METDPAFLAAEVYSFIGILASGIIFTRLALKARSIGSFRFQLSLFILMWVAAEIPHVLDSIGVITATNDLLMMGLELHALSMFVFAGFVIVRSVRFIRPPHAQPFMLNSDIGPSSPSLNTPGGPLVSSGSPTDSEGERR